MWFILPYIAVGRRFDFELRLLEEMPLPIGPPPQLPKPGGGNAADLVVESPVKPGFLHQMPALGGGISEVGGAEPELLDHSAGWHRRESPHEVDSDV